MARAQEGADARSDAHSRQNGVGEDVLGQGENVGGWQLWQVSVGGWQLWMVSVGGCSCGWRMCVGAVVAGESGRVQLWLVNVAGWQLGLVTTQHYMGRAAC